MIDLQAVPCGNPFSTRWTRPGALPYLLPEGETWKGMLERLSVAGWRGQVVGPHGSGKSTLLASLRRELTDRGVQSELVMLRNGGRAEPGLWRTICRRPLVPSPGSPHAPSVVLLLDGAEQLSRPARLLLSAACRLRRWGLVVTTHCDLGWPVLAWTVPSVAMAERIVDQLQTGRTSRVTPAQTAASFARHQGDLREMLFTLYELHEAQRRQEV